MDPTTFAAIDVTATELGDPRRARRLDGLVATLAARPGARPAAASGSWAVTKAAYRFWDAEQVSAAAIRAAHTATTRARVSAEPVVLAVQDTTEVDLTTHRATTGLGPLSAPSRRGLLLHSVLAVTPAGVPLGLLAQQVWARDAATTGKRHTRRQRATADKESRRWLDGQAAGHTALPPTTQVVTVADREADIYELFAAPRPAHRDLLIRATHDRRVTPAAPPADDRTDPDAPAAYLWATARAAPAVGERVVPLPRADDRPAREARLTIRVAPVVLSPPRHHRQRTKLTPVALTAVLAEEAAPPPDVAPVCRLLLTTLPVADLADAERCLDWYKQRWLIERYHFVLKSGCQIEELRLETAERLERALATYCVVAVRVLWLTDQARATPDQPCTVALTTAERQALACTVLGTPTPPAAPPPLGQAVRWIAQLGGFLGRRHDGEPGVRAVWRGLRRLADLTAMWQVLHPVPPDPPPRPPHVHLLGNG